MRRRGLCAPLGREEARTLWGSCNALAANVSHGCSSSSKNRRAQLSLNLVPNPQL